MASHHGRPCRTAADMKEPVGWQLSLYASGGRVSSSIMSSLTLLYRKRYGLTSKRKITSVDDEGHQTRRNRKQHRQTPSGIYSSLEHSSSLVWREADFYSPGVSLVMQVSTENVNYWITWPMKRSKHQVHTRLKRGARNHTFVSCRHPHIQTAATDSQHRKHQNWVFMILPAQSSHFL
jgi:hypothetical protein